jgi:uncharacterized membrane protein YdjX (TVP38/TMEM64 family)
VLVLVVAVGGRGSVAGGILAAVTHIREAGAVGVVAFAVAYVVGAVAFLPGAAMTLAAGFLYGPILGTAIVSPVSVLAATCSFLLGRTLARAWISRRIATQPRFAAVDEAVGREGFKIVALLRLSPLFPFSVLNYALGLTRVRLRDFVLASWLGMLPGTALYVARLQFARAILATGARAAIPPVPGLADAGYLTNETVFSLTTIPARFVIIGAGPIGCELAQAFARLGSRVTVVGQDRQLLPREDADAGRLLAAVLAREGIELRLGATPTRASYTSSGREVTIERDGRVETLEADEAMRPLREAARRSASRCAAMHVGQATRRCAARSRPRSNPSKAAPPRSRWLPSTTAGHGHPQYSLPRVP